MAQFARPSDDTVIGDYVDAADGTTDIFESIDESSASDADYIKSTASPSDEVYVAALSAVTDPVSAANHVMRMRTSNDVESGGEELDYTLELREGYTDEENQGTLIATLTRSGVTDDTWTDSSYTLSSGEANAITDYSDLFYRLVVTVAS